MAAEADALVIGAGPAGASTAILLAQAGWRVILVEQQVYPRQKVCGECLAAGSLALLDDLGVGRAVVARAGPELRSVGWMSRSSTIVADFPACADGPHRFGRALGRDQLDTLLLERARALGVDILQPAKVRAVRSSAARFDCEVETSDTRSAPSAPPARTSLDIRASIVIDGHGSWETGPAYIEDEPAQGARSARRSSDLFGFKASFYQSTLPRGLLPVLSFTGGYGGMVVAEDDRVTLACCIRRDALRECRARIPGAPAGAAIEQYLRDSCPGVRSVLDRAQHGRCWLSVGPLRAGIRIGRTRGPFLVGNAAGEAHPLIGEGINMALQSGFLLARELLKQPVAAIDASRFREIHQDYGAAWRNAFANRMRLAAAYAHLAMRPALCGPATAVLRRWPPVLARAARWAGKNRSPAVPNSFCEGAP
jgi:2-polyprenyl-6-methoxyphenol hydroxylase-like FAD-dependent oxidoreductase